MEPLVGAWSSRMGMKRRAWFSRRETGACRPPTAPSPSRTHRDKSRVSACEMKMGRNTVSILLKNPLFFNTTSRREEIAQNISLTNRI